MKRLCNVTVRQCATVIMVLLANLSVRADIDKKFFDAAAKKVWSMELPQFDPSADLSDSIFHDQSAVYIARYVGLVADYDQNPDVAKMRIFGIRTSNAVNAVRIRRNMIKLNDASAVEKFTDFSIKAPEKIDVKGYTVVSVKQAFGARIIKPDGSVADVDMSEAHTVTSGKKNNKDAEYKIVIPGLMAGDILDYFYYDEFFLDEISMEDMDMNIIRSYPTRYLIIDVRTDPELAMEYGAFNGVPPITTFPVVDGKNCFSLVLENVGSLDEEIPYFSTARQLPFLRFYVLNNNSRIEFVPKTARAGGIRHASTNFLLSDIASYISTVKPENNKSVSEAVSIVEKWVKAHGQDVGDREIADLAYLALRYAVIKQKNKTDELRFALQYYKVLEKLHVDIPFGIAVTSSRKDVPVDRMIRYNEPDYVVMVGDSCYFSKADITLLPGDLPPGYDGEAYWIFRDRPDSENLRTKAENGNLLKINLMANKLTMESDVSFDPESDDNVLSVTTWLTASGSQKSGFSKLVPVDEAVGALERYLGVKAADMSALIAPDDKEDQKEIAENLVKILWGDKDSELASYHVDSYGVTPDSAGIKIEFKGTVKNSVTHAGDNLIVNLGQFISEQSQIKGSQRKRDVSILLDFPKRYDTTIRFRIPEGYELVPESLEDFNRSVTFREATFNTMVTTEGDTVEVRLIERYPRSGYSADAWDALLAVLDAAHEFNSASIILRPK
ncbi:MAG: DUF3857 domain-containing protein [Muribaculaceae bacterium]|nr:DUF3857 domain-containing protein [Muribaculaceae bacterium]